MSDPPRLDYRPAVEEETIRDLKLTHGISPATTACLVLSATLIALPLLGLVSIAIGILRLSRSPRRDRRERVAAVVCIALGGINLVGTVLWFWKLR